MSDAWRIFGKGFWAVADQGLFAGANFAVNWMLALWLSELDYGAFATAFAAFLMLSVLHTGLLTEPMLVLVPQQFQSRLKPYYTILLGGHAVVSLVESAILAIWGILEKFSAQPQQQALGSALLCFAASGPFILLPWLMRRVPYSQMQPRRAAVAGLAYFAMMLSALTVVHHLKMLGIGSALAIMAGSGLFTGLGLAQTCTDRRSVSADLVREVFREHLQYGKWATVTQFLGFIPGNVYYFYFSASSSLADSAALKALNNLYNPLMQANSAICLLLLPAFVSTLGTARGKRLHYAALVVLAGGPAVWWLLMGIFHSSVISFMYHGKYQAQSSTLWVLGLQGIIAGMSGVYGSLLRARQKMRAVFLGAVVSAATAVTFGLALTIRFGIVGACWSIVLTYGLHHLTLWLFSLDTWKLASPSTRSIEAVA
jgi:O-antigen/teichoic acid export membrane protein